MSPRNTTYRAVQAIRPGKLEEMPLVDPPPGHVRIRVEACGVCHSDSGTVEGLFPIQWPRVPGHEAVGRIDALGDGIEGWALGQRVGVGFLGGSCGHCWHCRSGDLVNCQNQAYTGIQHDGGYAEVMIAKGSGLISVPDDLKAVAAAPLLCAGLTTYSALRNSPAKAGDLVAVLGATEDPIEISLFDLLFSSRNVRGALTGTPSAGDTTLKFSVLSGVAAMVETMPLERAAEAYEKMMSGKARFRMVLTMD